MSTLTATTPNGTATTTTNQEDVNVSIGLDANGRVTVTPGEVKTNTNVRFTSPLGALKIVLLSPSGKEAEVLTDADVFIPAIAGTYRFRCFYTPGGIGTQGALGTVSAEGGVIVVKERP
jgi:hypothetical protein